MVYEILNTKTGLRQMRKFTVRRAAEDAAKLLNYKTDNGPKGRYQVVSA